ncbi:MAG: hypothetical protein DRN53_05950 [Thermoprotei archaeon]|nr:MAG: hypothetical protein DRN53_05950 [Thermoprotei archaeon]
MRIEYIRNDTISRVLMGVPKGHKHLRAVLVLEEGRILVFSEAAVANLTRAYITIKTHPRKRAIELRLVKDSNFKEGYAKHQLLEIERNEDEIEEEITQILLADSEGRTFS